MKNPIYELIEDSVLSVLETDTGAFLPDEFTVTLLSTAGGLALARVRHAFVQLLRGLVSTQTGKPLPPMLKRIVLEIQDRRITVRSDKDPDPWLPAPVESAIH